MSKESVNQRSSKNVISCTSLLQRGVFNLQADHNQLMLYTELGQTNLDLCHNIRRDDKISHASLLPIEFLNFYVNCQYLFK